MICLIWLGSWLYYKVEKRMIRPEESLWLFRPGREMISFGGIDMTSSLPLYKRGVMPKRPPKSVTFRFDNCYCYRHIILLSPRFSRLFILRRRIIFLCFLFFSSNARVEFLSKGSWVLTKCIFKILWRFAWTMAIGNTQILRSDFQIMSILSVTSR